MKVIFCHGLESAPHGRKYQALVDAGFDVEAPDFQGLRLGDRVDTLSGRLGRYAELVLVGSSYGGVTALCAAIRHVESGGALAGLLLCAPALGRTEPPVDSMTLYPPVPTVIIHGTRDVVVPISLSREFAAAHGEVDLIEVDDEHRLANSLDVITDQTRRLVLYAASLC